MKKNIMARMFLFFLLLPTVYAQNFARTSNGDYQFNSDHFDLLKLTKDYVQSIGANLTYPAKLDSDTKRMIFQLYGKNKLSTSNMFEFITNKLQENNYAFIYKKGLQLYSIIEARDTRYQTKELYTDENKIPDSSELIMFSYKTKYVPVKGLERGLRPFLWKYGRSVNHEPSNQLLISDRAINVKRLLNMIKAFDTPESAKKLKQIKKEFKHEQSKDSFLWKKLSQSSVLFMLLFSLVGLIMGFLLRGYVIRRIEGGL